MRLTRAGEYAIRCVYYLSQKGKGTLVKKKEVAQAMEIPEQFLGKIAQSLDKSGIIEIIQGARGGFSLLVSPDDLSLLSVVEAEIGEIYLNDCVIKPQSCKNSQTCSMHKVWVEARDQLRDTLNEVTFRRLIQNETCLDTMTGSDFSVGDSKE